MAGTYRGLNSCFEVLCWLVLLGMELLAQMSNGAIYWVFTQFLAGLDSASPMLMLVCADALFVNILVANFIKIIYELNNSQNFSY